MVNGRTKQKGLEGRRRSRRKKWISGTCHFFFGCSLHQQWTTESKTLRGEDKSLNIQCSCLVQSPEGMALSQLPPKAQRVLPNVQCDRQVGGWARVVQLLVRVLPAVMCLCLYVFSSLLGKCIKCLWMVLRRSGTCYTGISLTSPKRRKTQHSLKW